MYQGVFGKTDGGLAWPCPLVLGISTIDTETAVFVRRCSESLFYNLSASSANFQLDQWYHVVMTLDGAAHVAHVYVNGVDGIVSSEANPYFGEPGYDDDSFYYLTIGNAEVFPEFQPYSGVVDNVRIYNRALSPAEVSAIYTLEQ